MSTQCSFTYLKSQDFSMKLKSNARRKKPCADEYIDDLTSVCAEFISLVITVFILFMYYLFHLCSFFVLILHLNANE